MRESDLQRYLHAHMPLSAAMQVTVVSIAPDAVVLGAPIAPNINHSETAFGGSVSALAILAAWSLVHTRLASGQQACRLVIQRSAMEYERPIHGDFSARATLEEPARWPMFLRTLASKGKARAAVLASVDAVGTQVGRFRGEFVAIAAP